MGRTSILTKDEALLRVTKASDLLTSLYYYMADCPLDLWYRYCSASAELAMLKKELRDDRQDQ